MVAGHLRAVPLASALSLLSLLSCDSGNADPFDTSVESDSEPERAFVQAVVASDQVGQTEPLAVLAGRYGPPLRGLYGTDLGWSFKHGNKLWMLFGDSWAAEERYFIGTPITPSDDALGFISLDAFRDGDQVEAHVRANPSFATKGWQAAPQIMQIAPREGAQPIQLWGGGWFAMDSGPGLTPLTGFSNGRQDNKAGAFGIFFRNAHLTCSGTCEGGFACDTGLGRCVAKGAFAPSGVAMACVKSEIAKPENKRDDCYSCADVGGICQDRKSSMYDETPRGRVSAVVVTQEVGSALRSNNLSADPVLQFNTRPWNTHRYFNAMARTVNDFDPARAGGRGNDYTTADGVAPTREGVFVWGRPHFGGLSHVGRDVQLYLAWVPMPAYADNGNFVWSPQYFAGLDAQGRPRFAAREVDSVALDLSGPPEERSKEVLEVVGQMSISWLPSLSRWVMIYGGGLSEQFGELIFGDDWTKIDWANVGPLYVRSAEQPWGPWTAPKPLLAPGDANAASGLYAAGGILYSAACAAESCVKTEKAWNNPGGLYGPNIIEPWTEARASSVDLYWNLSTWNPYEVVLMKSTLRATDLQ